MTETILGDDASMCVSEGYKPDTTAQSFGEVEKTASLGITSPAVAYSDFLRSKVLTLPTVGIEPGPINPLAKDFQRDITQWALRRGRSAIFADCGLGDGIPDYVVTMRKPGENPSPVAHEAEEFPVDQWQEWASPIWNELDELDRLELKPIWMNINPSDTLQHRSVREDKDEKHICPLQLEVIRRCLILWSNPGDLVLSPFAGIGSEGFMALGGKTRQGLSVGGPRRFVGIELKESYYKQAVANLGVAVKESQEGDLLSRIQQNATAYAVGIQ